MTADAFYAASIPSAGQQPVSDPRQAKKLHFAISPGLLAGEDCSGSSGRR